MAPRPSWHARGGAYTHLHAHSPPTPVLSKPGRESMSLNAPRRQQNASTTTRTQLDSHAAWYAKLDASLACLRQLMSPAQVSSKAWKPISPSSQGHTSSSSVGNAASSMSVPALDGAMPASVPSTSQSRLDTLLSPPSMQSVKVHKRSAARSARNSPAGSSGSTALLPPGSSQGAEIYRAVCSVPLAKPDSSSPELVWLDLQDAFRRLLATPECRPLWDDMVEDSEVVEELNAATRISRTIFRLGWPASHRDAITISRTMMDGETLLDVSTSLPRSADAPAYLRPAPPYVRSHLNLFAWCIQRTDDSALKVTVFWSWDLKGAWLGMPAGGLGAQLPNLVSSLVSHVGRNASRVPYLADFGRNVEVTSRKFDPTRDMITVDYQVISEPGHAVDQEQGNADVLVWSLPAAEGWDVHVDERPLTASTSSHASTSWQCKAFREKRTNGWKSAQVTVRIEHPTSELRADLEQGVRGRVMIQRIAASREVRLRLNDSPFVIDEVEGGDKQLYEGAVEPCLSLSSAPVLDDAASVSGLSLRSDVSSHSTGPTVVGDDMIKRTATPDVTPAIAAVNGKAPRPAVDRSQALASVIRRNYIYFTSLLQEPEAKWKHHSDSRGVTITQLDSIDPTLVVYRAEATFVGVGVWDIFATIGNAGVRSTWDKGAEETHLIEDLGDTSKLWWTKMRAAWPVSARDNVTVETSYKSPSSIHNFSFSSDDRSLFPLLPKTEMGTIRTQVDLRGWSIESLSPTTVHITLIEQSDPKGWTSKSSATPAAMSNAVAGVGDFAIKSGGPPIATRMLGAKTTLTKYEHDKGTFRLEYELLPFIAESGDGESGHVECEIRCDLETWAGGLDLVVDPPPINVSCLRRHKLSQGGSGLWLTIEHVAASLEDDIARLTVRKAGQVKEKGVVHVNGARIKVDVDELGEEELAQLREQKRTKPKRVPLDLVTSSPKVGQSKRGVGNVDTSSAPGTATPISRAGTPSTAATADTPLANETTDVFSDERPRQPMTCALDVLFLLRRIHAERGPDPAGNPAGWTLVSQRNGLFVRRRMMQSISSTTHVQRGDKVVEGLTAEDILSAISSIGCRKLWDEKVDGSMLLESYGNGAATGFFTTKASFPFRGRAFHLASLTARSGPSSMNLGSTANPTVFFHASASFPDRNSSFSAAKLNPTGLPLGKVLIDGWILETLDPYSSTLNYQIPSTRCTHVVAVDYAGSLPIAVNAMWNANLPRSILSVEEFVKSKGTLPSIRSPPCCVQVLGDGRDEDRNLIWNLEDQKSRRTCTLLTNTFNPSDKVFSVLVKVESTSNKEERDDQSLAVPFPRRLTYSNASTTKAFAASATGAQQNNNSEGDAGLGPEAAVMAAAFSDEQGGGMSRATSVNSIRSIASKNRPSTIRMNPKKPVDMVLIDVEVELRHYEKGYEVVAASELDKAAPLQANGSTDTEELLSLYAAPEAAQALPLGVSSYDLPPSAVLAATLDPSARPRKHLIRVTLPTATLFEEAREDPLSGPEPEDAPKWFHSLRERGATIRLIIRPLGGKDGAGRADQQGGAVDSSEIDSLQVPVVFQGKTIQVTHVNQTSAMLQRESEKEEGFARLKRVAPSQMLKAEAEEKKGENVLDDRLPALLQHPIAAAKDLRRGEGEDEVTGSKVQSGGEAAAVQAASAGRQLSPSTSAAEFPDPATPTAARAAETKSASQSSLVPSSASTPIMSLLNSYPLSRLGASTAVTTAVASGGLFSKSGSTHARDRLQGEAGRVDGMTKAEHEGRSNGKQGDRSSKADDEGMPGNLVLVTTEEIRKRLSDVKFSLSTLILVAIIAFLLGSLVRSLLEPADFILVDSLHPTSSPRNAGSIQDAAREEIKRMLGQTSSSASSSLSPIAGLTTPASSTVAKRELKRLIELRNMFGGRWDLVIAAARR